jgi:hypothetical protein
VLEIKSRESLPSLFSRKIQEQRLISVVIVWCLSLVIAMFVGLYYGTYLFRTTQAHTVRSIAQGVLEQGFAIPSNVLKGMLSNPRVITLDMDNNEYQKLSFLRESALKNDSSHIPEELKTQEVRGTIATDDIKQKAKFTLNGQNFDHIGLPHKWSLRVDIRRENTFLGMKKFNLLVPTTRSLNPLTEWLNQKLANHLGLISLRYEFVNVVLNGKKLGIYALEEHFDKRLIEHTKNREGVLFKLKANGKPSVFSKKRVLENSQLGSQWDYAQRLWESFLKGDYQASEVFDVPKMAAYYAMADITNGHHTHFTGNEFFYFNPITRRIEPIGREWSSSSKVSVGFKLFAEFPSPTGHEPEQFQKALFKDPLFVREYFTALTRFSSHEFIGDFLDSESENIERVRSILYKEYPYLSLDTDYLNSNTAYIHEFLSNGRASFLDSYLESENDNHNLVVSNRSFIPIIVRTPAKNGSTKVKEQLIAPDETKVLRLSDGVSMSELKYVIPGIPKVFSKHVHPWSHEKHSSIHVVPTLSDPYLGSMDNLTNVLLSGDIQLTENLIIAPGRKLIVEPGTNIDLTNNATIVSFAPIHFNGSELNPIELTSSDGTGNGIVVLNASDESTFSFTNFSNLTSSHGRNWSLTSPLVFYNSNFLMANSRFDNIDAEDALNSIRSKFHIENVHFANTRSDAFDSDFSQGTLEQVIFNNLGNDGIDSAGSIISAKDIYINNAGDKGISVGEDSEFSADGVVVKNSQVAVSAKDSSIFYMNDLEVANNSVAFALYQKKSEFGPGNGNIENVTLVQNEMNFLIEEKSRLTIDGETLIGDMQKVGDLMYGNVFGKASVR